MAELPTELPRDLQSDLHDMVDRFGEQAARGELVTINYDERDEDFVGPFSCEECGKSGAGTYVVTVLKDEDEAGPAICMSCWTSKPGVAITTHPNRLNDPSTCTCKRYSEKRDDGFIHYWYKSDPECKYIHLTALPMPHKVALGK